MPMMRQATIITCALVPTLIAADPAFAAARNTPAYFCREDIHAKAYQRELKKLNDWISKRSVGSSAFFDAGYKLRGHERRYVTAFRVERAKITAAIRSCRRAGYKTSKSTIMAALRRAGAGAKTEVRKGIAEIRADAAKWPAAYKALGKKWIDHVVHCIRLNRHKLGTGSASEWRAYNNRMQSRVNILRRRAFKAKKSAAMYEPMLDRRRKRMIGRLNRTLLSLPLYPRPCSVAAAPLLSGWAGKWATNRGDLCIKGRTGGLTVTPVGGGLLQRRNGRVTVGSASASTVAGRWSIPSPKFNGRFEWRMHRRGGRFTGRFSENPGDPMTRPWTGRRIGGC